MPIICQITVLSYTCFLSGDTMLDFPLICKGGRFCAGGPDSSKQNKYSMHSKFYKLGLEGSAKVNTAKSYNNTVLYRTFGSKLKFFHTAMQVFTLHSSCLQYRAAVHSTQQLLKFYSRQQLLTVHNSC